VTVRKKVRKENILLIKNNLLMKIKRSLVGKVIENKKFQKNFIRSAGKPGDRLGTMSGLFIY
jgi:hypothetical protein